MTAAHPSPYVFSIDWDDDGYLNALAAIPTADLQVWDIDVGGIDEELAPTPTDGAIKLFNADGRYQNVGTYTDAQLRSGVAGVKAPAFIERSPASGRACGGAIRGCGGESPRLH